VSIVLVAAGGGVGTGDTSTFSAFSRAIRWASVCVTGPQITLRPNTVLLKKTERKV